MTSTKHRRLALVTGFPRLRARKMVGHILAMEPETRICVVVLPKLIAEAAALVDSLDDELRARIEILEGDAAAIDLGLSGREYRQLAAAVTHIHHMAHVGYVGVDLETAEYANIGGAVEMVELGRAASKLRCLVHHSTAQVSGDRAGVVYEDELDVGQGFHSVVRETRMKAEKVMRRAMAEMPIAVVRPTMMVGHSVTGQLDRIHGATLLVLLVLGLPDDVEVPMPSLGDNPLNIVPVDFVVEAAYHIGRHPYAPGGTFHLAAQEDLTAQRVFELVAKAGGRKLSAGSSLPTQLASAILRTPGVKRLVHEPRHFLRQLSCAARYDTERARDILEPAEISCPPLASYVDTWVAGVQEHMKLRLEGQDSGEN